MRSIMSIALAAVMMLAVLTGCGRNKNNNSTAMPAVTNTPVTATERPAAITPNAAGNNGNNAVNDMVNGAEDAVNGVINGAEDAVNGVVGGIENAVEDTDGRADDRDNVVLGTPEPR